MPDFIVIDEVNNKVGQSESNISSKVAASNTALHNKIGAVESGVNTLHQKVDELQLWTKETGTVKSVWYNTGQTANDNYGDEGYYPIIAKFIAPRTGLYHFSANWYSSNSKNIGYPKDIRVIYPDETVKLSSHNDIMSHEASYSNHYSMTRKGLMEAYVGGLAVGTANASNELFSKASYYENWKSGLANGGAIACRLYLEKGPTVVSFTCDNTRGSHWMKNVHIYYLE